jgi:hypothetical protein
LAGAAGSLLKMKLLVAWCFVEWLLRGQQLRGEQCEFGVASFIEGYIYSVNERISIFIDHKRIYVHRYCGYVNG